jgi:hypoxanthine phosphoribosyltransferase
MRPSVTLLDKTFVPFIPAADIAAASERIAAEINRDFAGREMTVVVTLKGAMVFAMDLLRLLQLPCCVEVLSAKSYGAAMVSSGAVEIRADFAAFRGKHLLLVEDIVDSGLTIAAVLEEISRHEPASVAVAAMFSKPAAHKVKIPVAYIGMEIEPLFIVGYGLDYAEYGRELPDVYKLAE